MANVPKSLFLNGIFGRVRSLNKILLEGVRGEKY